MKKILAFLLAALMLFSLCACGSSAKAKQISEPAAAPAMMMDNSYVMEAEAAEMPVPAPMLAGGLASEESAIETGASSGGAEINPDKIIYSAEATVETTDFDKALGELDALIKQYGGWVESSSVSGANYYSKSKGQPSTRSAYYGVRIPSANFSALMGSLATIGNVPYTHTYTENVTAQYYDTEARLTAYRTQEARLLEMMEKAETVEDIITIEDRLTELRYKIESLQSSLNNWDRRVNYSTVNVSLEEVRSYTPEAGTQISYGRELWLALTNALKGVGQFFKDALVFLVSALPTLIILAVLVLVLWKPVKKLIARRRAKKDGDKEK